MKNFNIDNYSPIELKIALFRSLFRGREDVYPRRFENRKTGKSGYVFACQNEWVRGICEKPKIKCSECKFRRFIPITDEVIFCHLSGCDRHGNDFVMGIYPMLLDETCFFLAADFDKAKWAEDALAYFKTCRKLGLPVALERSRSGKGAHVWLFFEEAFPAALARKLGCHILTETMESYPDMGLESYDRLFPNQDTLPKGGFGNLIALPLQKKARALGNSSFIDENLIPYEDQWAFLSRISKIPRLEVERIVNQAELRGKIIGVRLEIIDEEDKSPWRLSPSRQKKCLFIADVPKEIELVVGDQIYIDKNQLPLPLRNRLIRIAAFQNPEFYHAQAMRLPTYGIPRIISCAEDYPNHIALPRGCLDDVNQLFSDLKIVIQRRDERLEGQSIDFTFQGELRAEQQLAADAMLQNDIGTLSATTAFGKTVIASWLISKRQVNTLILVHRKQLQEQWIERLCLFLNISKSQIGRIGGGKRRPKGLIDVVLIQSLIKQDVVDDIVSQYGHLVVDECHHLPAHSFEQVVRRAKAKFVTGLTATLKRKDGHHPIIIMQCGPIRYHVNAKEQATMRPFKHFVFVRPTSFVSKTSSSTDQRMQFNEYYQELVRDGPRNKLICEDVLKAVQNGRSPIVLTERKEHLDLLTNELAAHVPHLIVLRGGMSHKKTAQLAQRLAEIPENEGRILLATGKYIGEGFDDPRLDTLFLTLPISWRGTLTQYVGRLHRLCASKKEVQVYDYADLNVPMLERMFNKRSRSYEALGYEILVPASAIAGWPIEVPLPVDPTWKKDYSASVKRLVFDGVDVPLAYLFVEAAKDIPDEAEGIERARSTVEAFLFRRLNSLQETAGKFLLNAKLPIPFDLFSHMEVDFLFPKGRIVLEVDGRQHLVEDAYRRDRRKDLLLQQNGYLVIRFLAEDVSKHLDDVLNTILKVLSRDSNASYLSIVFEKAKLEEPRRAQEGSYSI